MKKLSILVLVLTLSHTLQSADTLRKLAVLKKFASSLPKLRVVPFGSNLAATAAAQIVSFGKKGPLPQQIDVQCVLFIDNAAKNFPKILSDTCVHAHSSVWIQPEGSPTKESLLNSFLKGLTDKELSSRYENPMISFEHKTIWGHGEILFPSCGYNLEQYFVHKLSAPNVQELLKRKCYDLVAQSIPSKDRVASQIHPYTCDNVILKGAFLFEDPAESAFNRLNEDDKQ